MEQEVDKLIHRLIITTARPSGQVNPSESAYRAPFFDRKRLFNAWRVIPRRDAAMA